MPRSTKMVIGDHVPRRGLTPHFSPRVLSVSTLHTSFLGLRTGGCVPMIGYGAAALREGRGAVLAMMAKTGQELEEIRGIRLHKEGELESGKDSPEDVATNFTCAMFETPQDVLRGVRHMAAVEIGCEPIVRKHIRSIFMNKAVVTTKPTPDGNLIIDPYHKLSGIKWLREKPLNKFVDAHWLLVQKTEEEKLLKVTISLPDGAQKECDIAVSFGYFNYKSSRGHRLRRCSSLCIVPLHHMQQHAGEKSYK